MRLNTKYIFVSLLFSSSICVHAGSAENIIKAAELMIEKSKACSEEHREMGGEKGVKELGGKKCLNFAYGMIYFEIYKDRELNKMSDYEWGKSEGKIKSKVGFLYRHFNMQASQSEFKIGVDVFEKINK